MGAHLYHHLTKVWEESENLFFDQKTPTFWKLKLDFFLIQKVFRRFSTFPHINITWTSSEKKWAKSENNFGTHPSIHPPSVTLRKYRGQKWADTPRKLKSKKHFPGADIKQKEIKLGPHRGPPKDGPPPGDKKVMIYVNFPLCTFQLSCKTEHYTNTMKIFGRTYLKGLS